MKFTSTLVLLAASSSNAFAPRSVSTRATTAIRAQDDNGTERGVSVDQDGKSNVWAIEPKMEVESTSNEDKIKGYLIAGVSLVAFGGAAGFALTNLPDPNQF
mmetsp:Transcript_409/g.931  ORF Transcript_409/g.931 Transcript_409/m.931 type:complete len:102 (-) Transcript_409:350-655(-)|eukprot:CAMPEP_0197177074 /NCGR_PEP_ID=MMETSP1423-20130617/2805_1 /TAXON_ID=476441 /ORGANISM="Pseudo-nitzschia heimii, Strain UNC1101" /LENGTH=101 /DNA_ID=CAMNT_0042626561 /DNA_START=124 /DNA_END=429 /DNA_ORIENTATION=+